MPYGQLPNEVVEIIDDERVLPGITFIHKISEDCPLLNEYDSDEMTVDKSSKANTHQTALIYDAIVPSSGTSQGLGSGGGGGKDKAGSEPGRSLIEALRALTKRRRPQELSPKDFHQVRYTFVHQLFDSYKMLINDAEFLNKFERLENWYIWNIYR